jgi:macrolide-specific efflux system membrane fusion protein
VKRKRKGTWLLALLVLAIGGAGTGLWWQNNKDSDNTLRNPTTAEVVRREFSSSVLATGAVQAQVGAEVRVGARISGKVERLRANIGDYVTKGDVIAELEKADLQSTVTQRRAELDLARAKLAAVESLRPKEIEKAKLELSQWQATRNYTEKVVARKRELVEKNVIPQEEYDAAQERLLVAEARLASAGKSHELATTRYQEDLRQAKAEVACAEPALKNAEVQRDYATITAPIDGVIASVATEEGETVAAGMQAPTFVTIIDLDRLQVDTYVDEVDIGKILLGQQAVFTVDAFPADEFEGKVTAIYPKAVIQDNVVNYDVVVDITTPYRGRLRPEMTTNVTILLETRKDVLAVPAKTVHRVHGKNVAYVLTGGQPEEREIKIGWKDKRWVEVATGLQEGETVLLRAPDATQ